MAPTTSLLLLTLLPTSLLASFTPTLLRRDTLTFSSELTKRCIGDCVTCFGPTYQPCPGSDYYCYSPGDSSYGIESCTTPESSDSSPSSSSPPSDTTGYSDYNITYTDWCDNGDCKSCFGSTYVQCPGDNINCYDPANATTTCPDFASGGSSSGGGVSSSYSYDVSASSSTTTLLSSLDTSIASTPPSFQTTATTAPTTVLSGIGGGGASATEYSGSGATAYSSSSSTSSPSSTSSSFVFSSASGIRTISASDSPAATSAGSSPISQTVNGAGGVAERVLGGLMLGAVGFGFVVLRALI